MWWPSLSELCRILKAITQEDELNLGPANGRQEGEWGVCTALVVAQRIHTAGTCPIMQCAQLIRLLIGGIST